MASGDLPITPTLCQNPCINTVARFPAPLAMLSSSHYPGALDPDLLGTKLAKVSEFQFSPLNFFMKTGRFPEFTVFPEFRTEFVLEVRFSHDENGWQGTGSLW